MPGWRRFEQLSMKVTPAESLRTASLIASGRSSGCPSTGYRSWLSSVSPMAVADLEGIGGYTLRTWGRAQADLYLYEVRSRCD
jgi:hypothetical protein